jgi:hypothetical protein
MLTPRSVLLLLLNSIPMPLCPNNQPRLLLNPCQCSRCLYREAVGLYHQQRLKQQHLQRQRNGRLRLLLQLGLLSSLLAILLPRLPVSLAPLPGTGGVERKR